MAKNKSKLTETLDGKKIGYQEQNAKSKENATTPAASATAAERDDSWKEDLRAAYDTSARRQIEESDKAYNQAKANADRQALSRGMQRSSYNNATLANLDSDKVRAQNVIRENTDAAYNQAVLNQQNVKDQLDWQKEQAAQSQSNWQAQFDYQQQQDAQSQANWQAQFENTVQQQQQSQANWQAQFDATQQQQAWQNQFQQTQWDWQVAQANAANAAASAGSPGSNNPGSKKPWEVLGITEEEYYKLHPEEKPGNDQSNIWTWLHEQVGNYYGLGK